MVKLSELPRPTSDNQSLLGTQEEPLQVDTQPDVCAQRGNLENVAGDNMLYTDDDEGLQWVCDHPSMILC